MSETNIFTDPRVPLDPAESSRNNYLA